MGRKGLCILQACYLGSVLSDTEIFTFLSNTDPDSDRQTDTHRQTDRQTDKQRDTHRHTDRPASQFVAAGRPTLTTQVEQLGCNWAATGCNWLQLAATGLLMMVSEATTLNNLVR